MAIVGGGLGGLTTAVAIRRALPNASVQVRHFGLRCIAPFLREPAGHCRRRSGC